MDRTTPDEARRVSAATALSEIASHRPSLAMRKELALARATLSRMEVAQARTEFEASVHGWNWLTWLMPPAARAPASAAAPLLGKLLHSRRLLGAALSFFLARRAAKASAKADARASAKARGERKTRPRARTLRRAATSVELGSLAMAALQAWRTWRRIKVALARMR